MIHNILNVRAAVTYVPYQDLENKRMLLDFLVKPGEFVGHIRRYTNSLTTQMIFGFRTVDSNDPKLKQLFQVSALSITQNGMAIRADETSRDLSSGENWCRRPVRKY